VALSDLFSRRRKDDADADPGRGEGPVQPTKALARFLAGLNAREQAVILDLGPVVGSNVNFFGEQLGCKIFVEDLSKDIERHVREDKLADMAAFFGQRFPQEAGSIDGILCWDVFDFVDRPAAQVLAAQLTRILRPDGVLLAFFRTAEPPRGAKPEKPTYTRHVVVDPGNVQYRSYAASRGKQKPLPNRDIQRMFEPLRITEQFLLKTNMREVLFRKPAAS
jgi:SAM-dependent methyltransferase